MSENEAVLLRRFAHMGDAEAFAEITRRYAAMVYGVCLRVTGDAEHARDATQDTFYQLLKSAGKVTGSLGGWLHQVATHRAVDLVRRDSARRQREQTFATDLLPETEVWSDVSPLVDEAMNEIDSDQRDLLLRHFLQGETTVQLAAAANVSQPTMSRRVASALEQLRHRLRAKGIGVSAAALATMMGGAASTAPAAVMAELGKMAMASSGAVAGATTTLAVMKAAAVIAVAVVGVGGWMIHRASRPVVTKAPTAATATAVQLSETISTGPEIAPTPAESLRATAAPEPGAPAAKPPAQGAARARVAVAATGFGGWQPIMGSGSDSRLDSDPATAVGSLNRFAIALSMAEQRPEHLVDCFVPGPQESNKILQIIQYPITDEDRSSKQCLLSLAAPIEVVETSPLDDGMRVKWQARVAKEFSLAENGQPKTWKRGDHFELEVRLKQIGTEWKIAGF